MANETNAQRPAESGDPILAYLRYLRDISRKIGQQAGFARAVIQQTKTRPNFALQTQSGLNRIGPKSAQYAHFKNTLAWLDKNPDKRLFLGFGLVAGRFENKTYAAPLLLQEAWLEREEISKQLVLTHDYSSTTLNYDLLSGLSGRSNFAEDEAFDESYQNEVEFVEDAERMFREVFFGSETLDELMRSYARKNWAKNLEAVSESQRPFEFMLRLAADLFRAAKESLPGFGQIDYYSGGYDFAQELEIYGQKRRKTRQIKSIFEEPATYAEAAHFFVARIPDELSAFHALDNLCKEAAERGFRNPLLAKLLNSALNNQSFKIGFTPQPGLARVIEERLPLPLSASQNAALRNVWENELSYVQGPPGTGKSHTITAALACAAAMNKSVLVVSQKQAALQVVQDKIAPLLSGPEAKMPLVYYDKNARNEIRAYTKHLLEISQNPTELGRRVAELEAAAEKSAERLDEINTKERELQNALADFVALDAAFCDENEAFFSEKRNLASKYNAEAPARLMYLEPEEKYRTLLGNMRSLAAAPPTLLARMYDRKFRSELVEKLKANPDALSHYGLDYAEDLTGIFLRFTKANRLREKIPGNSELLRYDLEKLAEDKRKNQLDLARADFALNRLKLLQDDQYRDELNKLDKLLYWRNPAIIAERLRGVDFGKILEMLPFWAFELRDVGNLLPMQPQLFDLVVVDEASQVNLAEILPAFYRGINICVVGDHKQLGIDSTGVNFQLSKKYDALTWTRYGASGLAYTDARERELTVTDASTLDFLRSKNHGVALPQKMLDEHFRSLPALAHYTAKYYSDTENGLRVMTERPGALFRPAFLEIEVEGQRAEDKTAPEEAALLVQLFGEIAAADFSRLFELADYTEKPPLSVGVISMLRSQIRLIEEKLSEAFPETTLEKHNIMVGTPEEFQGNERDVMFFSLCLDESRTRSSAHYQNESRLNVATSRARLYTIVLHAGIPQNMTKLRDWLRHFRQFGQESAARNWTPADTSPYPNDAPAESLIKAFARKHGAQLDLFQGAAFCGQREIPFVLYNGEDDRAAIIELEGRSARDHFNGATGPYFERAAILRRAGWPVFYFPYYLQYREGFPLQPEDSELERFWRGVREKLSAVLFPKVKT